MTRTSIEITSFAHQNPIPSATRIGPLLVSSVISPFIAGTRDMPDGIDAQVAILFERVGEVLAAGGATWDDVAKMTFFVRDLAFRDALNAPWAERFPDPHSRPSRHTQIAQLTGGTLVSCDVLAWVGG